MILAPCFLSEDDVALRAFEGRGNPPFRFRNRERLLKTVSYPAIVAITGEGNGRQAAPPACRSFARFSHRRRRQSPSSWPMLFRSSPHPEQVNVPGSGEDW
jgi:hypothetical protein